MSPLVFETRNVEPSRMLMLLSLIGGLFLSATRQSTCAPLVPVDSAIYCRFAWHGCIVVWRELDERRLAARGKIFISLRSITRILFRLNNYSQERWILALALE